MGVIWYSPLHDYPQEQLIIRSGLHNLPQTRTKINATRLCIGKDQSTFQIFHRVAVFEQTKGAVRLFIPQ
jgi:hypothetical protein